MRNLGTKYKKYVTSYLRSYAAILPGLGVNLVSTTELASYPQRPSPIDHLRPPPRPSHCSPLAALLSDVRPTGRSCGSMASRQCWRLSIPSTSLQRGQLLTRSNARVTVSPTRLPSYACSYHLQPQIELALASVRMNR